MPTRNWPDSTPFRMTLCVMSRTYSEINPSTKKTKQLNDNHYPCRLEWAKLTNRANTHNAVRAPLQRAPPTPKAGRASRRGSNRSGRIFIGSYLSEPARG